MLERWLRTRPLALLLTFAALVLVPWTIWLALRLPSRHVSPHWDVAWVGFDVALTGTMAATGVALWQRSRLVPALAAAAGTLLLVDAWFDVVTSQGDELAWAIVGAAAAEVPLALVCFWLVRRSVDRARRDAEDAPAPRWHVRDEATRL